MIRNGSISHCNLHLSAFFIIMFVHYYTNTHIVIILILQEKLGYSQLLPWFSLCICF